MNQAEIMREKQRRADLKAQGIDPDAVDEPKKKEYDDSFLNKYNYDYGNEEEESKDEKVEESKEEDPAPQQKGNKKK